MACFRWSLQTLLVEQKSIQLLKRYARNHGYEVKYDDYDEAEEEEKAKGHEHDSDMEDDEKIDREDDDR